MMNMQIFQLMKWSQSILGTRLFHKLMKATFYGQFVGGEDRIAICPLVNRNKQFGVKSILDYSAEEDVSSEQAKEAEMRYALLINVWFMD